MTIPTAISTCFTTTGESFYETKDSLQSIRHDGAAFTPIQCLHLLSSVVHLRSSIAMKNWEKRQVNWARLALSSGVFVSWFFCVVVAAAVAVLLLYFVGFHEKFRRNNKTKIEIVHERAQMCKNQQYNTHIASKKSESYEKSANTHSTYYVCAYVKFKIMRLHLHRINIDKNFVCSIYVYGSRKCTITYGSIPSCSDDLVLSSIIILDTHIT